MKIEVKEVLKVGNEHINVGDIVKIILNKCYQCTHYEIEGRLSSIYRKENTINEYILRIDSSEEYYACVYDIPLRKINTIEVKNKFKKL